MRFYTRLHMHYCGIDLHARTMCPCVLNQAGDTLLQQNIKTDLDLFLRTIIPFRVEAAALVALARAWDRRNIGEKRATVPHARR